MVIMTIKLSDGVKINMISDKKFRAVLVDDEVWALRGLQGVVDWDSFGFEIVGTFTDSVEALSKIKELSPDILFTDIRMPDLDGMELIEKVKNIIPGIFFVIVSAYRDFEIAKKALKNEVSDYLLKPLDKEEVKNALKSIHERLSAQQKKDFNILDYDLSDSKNLSNPEVERTLSSINYTQDSHILISSSPCDGFRIHLKGYPYVYIVSGSVSLSDNALTGQSTLGLTISCMSEKLKEACMSYDGGFSFSSNEQTSKIQAYLYENLSQKLSMEDVAGAFFLSKSYIFELFREYSDTSAMNFLKSVRLNKAARLLKSTQRNVGSIAEEVGFDDLSYFSKTFKAKYGVSPEQY